MYLTTTRRILMYVVSIISRFMESHKDSHWKVGKIFLRYVGGTLGFGVWYTHTPKNTLTWYIDSDFEGSIDDRKNTCVYDFHLGTNMISYGSQK